MPKITNIKTADRAGGWTVQVGQNAKGEDRYRYRCDQCGHTGRWFVNGNDADGDNHLYYKHGEGE